MRFRTRIICQLFIMFFSNTSFAQPQWKFYIAFEDAVGSKDTLWMIYDTTAHGILPVDTALGEGKVQLDYLKMNMYIFNHDGDTTKTVAFPYSVFPNHNLVSIKAFNFQYPILISWDTSLFHSPMLPSQPNSYFNHATIDNDYFYNINNGPPGSHEFDMLIDNSALAPAFSFGSQTHFPLSIHLFYDDSTIGIEDQDKDVFASVFPVPFKNYINIKSITPIIGIEIYDMLGQIVYENSSNYSFNLQIETEGLSPGAYCIALITEGGMFNRLISKSLY